MLQTRGASHLGADHGDTHGRGRRRGQQARLHPCKWCTARTVLPNLSHASFTTPSLSLYSYFFFSFLFLLTAPVTFFSFLFKCHRHAFLSSRLSPIFFLSPLHRGCECSVPVKVINRTNVSLSKCRSGCDFLKNIPLRMNFVTFFSGIFSFRP